MAEFTEVQTPDMHEPRPDGVFPPALRPAIYALIGALALVAIPYAVTAALPDSAAPVRREVAEFRLWIPEDPLPFSNLFRTGPRATEAVLPPGTVAPATEGGEVEVPPAVALVIDDVEPAPQPAEPPSAVLPEAGEAPPGAPDSPPTQDAPPAPEHRFARIHIPPAAWEGLKTVIEDPSGAMKPFYERLAAVALKEPGALVRISHFGDSAIAADGMPSAVRHLLQQTFGDGGHGFSLVAASNNWYRRKDVIWTTSGWNAEAYISDGLKDGRYGFGGTAALGRKGAKASWQTVPEDKSTIGSKVSKFTVTYMAQPGGGELTVRVDGVDREVIATAAEAAEDRSAVVTLPDGAHTIELVQTSGGKTKVYGVTLERDRGVVYDGLGTIGARDTRWRNIDADHIVAQFAARAPDLGVFMYGGNQLQDNLTMDRYRDMLRDVVKLWRRALGPKSCLLMSAIDHGERYRGRVRTVPRQLEIMQVQREVALAEGCAWFSLYDAMGGEGTIGRWFEAHLAEGDLAHPTAKGAVVLGQLFYKALMQGFAEFVKQPTE